MNSITTSRRARRNMRASRAETLNANQRKARAHDAMTKTVRRILGDLHRSGASTVVDFRPQGSPEEPAWKAQDRAWFAANPDRTMHLRRLFDDEAASVGWGPLDELDVVLVIQYAPGVRVRHAAFLGRLPLIDDERTCFALWWQYRCGGTVLRNRPSHRGVQ
jgi:hypothetical protein